MKDKINAKNYINLTGDTRKKVGGGGGCHLKCTDVFCYKVMVERKKAFSLLHLVSIQKVSVSRSVRQSVLHLVFGWTLIPWFHVFLNLSLPVCAAGSATVRKI